MLSSLAMGRVSRGLNNSGVGLKLGSTKLTAAMPGSPGGGGFAGWKGVRSALTLAVFSVLLSAAVSPAHGQTETTLYNFGGQAGASPRTGQRDSAVPAEKNKGGAISSDQNPPLFLPVVSYDVSVSPFSIAVADLNSDGHLDVAVANDCQSSTNCNNGGVTVLLGNGDGTFQAPVSYNSGGVYAASVAIADVNGDGHRDLIVANNCQSTTNCGSVVVGVLLGNGDGTFQAPVSYSLGVAEAFSVAASDLNGDGHPDLVVTSGCQNAADCVSVVSVLLGNGDGTFQAPVSYSSGGVYATSVAIADLNGDGRQDLAVANECQVLDPSGGVCWGYAPGEVSVLLGNGDGTFQAPVSYNSNAYQAFSVAVADLNHDGHPDLAVVSACQSESNCVNGVVGVLLGNGDGTFQPVVNYNTGGGNAAFSVAIADLNGDGHLDLAVATASQCDGCSNSGVSTLLGNGDGTFQPAVSHNSGGISGIAFPSIAIADLNGDGKPDLLVDNECQSGDCQDGIVGVLMHVGDIPTTTREVSSPNPSAFMQTLTLSATVISSSGSPTGTVAFYDGSTALGSATLANGSAAISVSSLSVGSHVLTAVYQGSVKLGSSASSPLTQVVTIASTTTSIASSKNPVALNSPVTYIATVTGQYGGAPTGSVTFADGGVVLATESLTSNFAVYTTSCKTRGAHAIAATYSGDSKYAGSISAALEEQAKGFPSKTVVTTSESPSQLGQPVTFTAEVTSPKGTIAVGELVTFYDGKTAIGTGATTGGIATFTTSSLTAKTHLIKGTYAGDSVFDPSTGTVTQVVDKYTTTTSLNSSLNPSQFTQPVTFTARVTSSGPTPTGRVKFLDGTAAIGSATLSGDVATLTKSSLAIGTHLITAEYEGDADNAESTSSALDQVVQ
jgi:hypothetical protein